MDVATDHRRILDSRSRNLERFIDSLAAALAPGMSPRTATDILWTYTPWSVALDGEAPPRERAVQGRRPNHGTAGADPGAAAPGTRGQSADGRLVGCPTPLVGAQDSWSTFICAIHASRVGTTGSTKAMTK